MVSLPKKMRPQFTEPWVAMTTVSMAAETCDHFEQPAAVQFLPLESMFIDSDLSWTIRMSGGTGITETLVWPQFGGAASTAMPTSPPLPVAPRPPVPMTTIPPVPTWPPVALLPAWPPVPTTFIPPEPLVEAGPEPADLNPQPARTPGTRQGTR